MDTMSCVLWDSDDDVDIMCESTCRIIISNIYRVYNRVYYGCKKYVCIIDVQSVPVEDLKSDEVNKINVLYIIFDKIIE